MREGTNPTRSSHGVEFAALLLAIVISAYLLTVSSVRPQASWVIWLALVPLFTAIRIYGPVRAGVCGAMWSLSLFGFSWLFSVGSFRVDFSAASAVAHPASWIANFSMLTALAAPALFAAAASALTRWIGFSPLILAVGWLGVELVASPLVPPPTVPAWLAVQHPIFETVARALGYAFVALLAAYINGWIVEGLTRLPRYRSDPRRFFARARQVLIRVSQNDFPVWCRDLAPCSARAPPCS